MKCTSSLAKGVTWWANHSGACLAASFTGVMSSLSLSMQLHQCEVARHDTAFSHFLPWPSQAVVLIAGGHTNMEGNCPRWLGTRGKTKVNW